jgi:probable F420-dependent oxidoreductase
MSFPISGTGIWSHALRYGEASRAADLAAELEALGFHAVWIPDVGGDVFGAVENLLRATKTATIATGILNLWMHQPAETAAEHARLTAAHGRRFLVGIGVSHAPLIDAKEPGRYRKPLARMREFLDGLDAASAPLPGDDRVLAALGPKMLSLARDRAGGAHPYLVTPEHTALARQLVGPRKLVLPEQGVVLETDPDRARAIGRTHLASYLALPNYANNWKRLGFTDDDVTGGGSDRLVDALVAWGDEEAIAARVHAHRDAGADHVCLQVLAEDVRAFPLDDCRRLAAVLNA